MGMLCLRQFLLEETIPNKGTMSVPVLESFALINFSLKLLIVSLQKIMAM